MGANGLLETERRIQIAKASVIVLDGLDFLLAAYDVSMPKILDMVQTLRCSNNHLIITAAADSPLIHCASNAAPLEQDHAGLVMSLAHQASSILSVRSLDTGLAKDISGVLTVVARHADANESHEYLYHVASDGTVKVFLRGAS